MSYENYTRLRKEVQERLAIETRAEEDFAVKRVLVVLHA